VAEATNHKYCFRKKFLIKQSTKFLTIKGNLFSSFIL